MASFYTKTKLSGRQIKVIVENGNVIKGSVESVSMRREGNSKVYYVRLYIGEGRRLHLRVVREADGRVQQSLIKNHTNPLCEDEEVARVFEGLDMDSGAQVIRFLFHGG